MEPALARRPRLDARNTPGRFTIRNRCVAENKSGAVLRDVRRRAGLTQAGLADRAGQRPETRSTGARPQGRDCVVTYCDEQRLTDVLTAPTTIRAHRQRGGLDDGAAEQGRPRPTPSSTSRSIACERAQARNLDNGSGSNARLSVETRGIEPLTPALQRRCSAN
ncbi:MAG: hypothetical protein JWM76_78 [Pseudonocardiales bacterium]|nr:hypothetical protein [Pseudonocardiales bacterium]